MRQGNPKQLRSYWLTLAAWALATAEQPGTVFCMCDTSSENERPAGNTLERGGEPELQGRNEPRFRAIVQALARHAAREQYALSCLAARKDSDSGG